VARTEEASGPIDILVNNAVAYTLKELQGHELLDGWQAGDLAAQMRVREEFHEKNGWPHTSDFCRALTLYPDVPRTQCEG
jgi:hypothetical protein